MREKLTTFAVVSLITLTIWLYAEAESLGRESIVSRVEIASGREDISVRPDDTFDGRVSVEISGSKSAIARARQTLDQRINLQFSDLDLSAIDGPQRVRLAPALRNNERLQATGVSVDDVRPSEVEVTVTNLVVAQLPIRASLSSLEVAGDVTVDPPTCSVRLPKAVYESEQAWPEVLARPTQEQIARLPDSGPVSLQVPVTLPESMRSTLGVELLTPRVTLRFAIKNTLVAASFSAPVQVLLPSIEQTEWEVTLEADDALIDVDLQGPQEIITRLKSPSEGLIAILALSSDDLAAGITSKPVSFAVLRDGLAVTAPDSIIFPAQPPSVRFTIRRRELP